MSWEPSDRARAEIDAVVARYPQAHSAILPVMHVIQRDHGFIPEAAKPWVAERIDMALAKVEEVLSFYTMLYSAPVGRKHVQVCRSLACYLRGEGEVTEAIGRVVGIKPGETTPDGKFSLIHVECLGSCGTAPMMQVNDDYHENLTPQRVEELLEEWSR